MEIRSNALLFPKTRNSGPIVAGTTLAFPRAVTAAVATLTGYSATFENHDDHHLGQLNIDLTTTIDAADATQVHIDGTFALRDWSGTFDDAYSGTVEFAVFAEMVPATGGGAGSPRTDLVVTDAEITQGIQHFRSATFLDSANVFPDNSIRLVANKPTAVRLWIDYDRNAGLPPIATLTGLMTVTDANGGVRAVLPNNVVTPKYESQIKRANVDDTLNFIIPEDACRGAVTFSVKVFSQADVNQFAADFVRTLNFEDMPTLKVFAVGVNYTGTDTIAGKPTAAPVATDFATLFTTTELLYPIPQVQQTGYMTLDYDDDIQSDISKGCDKFDDLRDAVKDLRGDSTDVFYGLLNTGVDTGSVGGCGGDGGACVGMIGQGGTAAHEMGHVFGRQHAPCDNVTRCARPLNTDDAYPRYAGYDSDSIGEFGFNTTSAKVLNPGDAHDMMGYSGNNWISPYTYKALMTRVPQDNGGIAGSAAAAVSAGSWPRGPITVNERIPMARPHLFTRFTIERDRSVEWTAAFHFPTGPQPVHGTRTKFVIEQRDGQGRVLLSEYLYENRSSCGCSGGDCLWPRKFRQDIPYDPEARTLVILECDKEIFSVAIPEPPNVALTCSHGEDLKSDTVSCKWHTEQAKPDGLWYLLQWRDRRGVWRGVAPRTKKTEWRVPKSLWGRDKAGALRVLATSGIATGVSEVSMALARRPNRTNGPRQVAIQFQGVDASTTTVELPPTVRVAVTTADGSTSTTSQVSWFDARGGLIGRGRSIALNTLPVGVHTIRASVANGGDGDGTASWLIERTRDGRVLWHRGTITYPDPSCASPAVKATQTKRRKS